MNGNTQDGRLWTGMVTDTAWCGLSEKDTIQLEIPMNCYFSTLSLPFTMHFPHVAPSLSHLKKKRFCLNCTTSLISSSFPIYDLKVPKVMIIQRDQDQDCMWSCCKIWNLKLQILKELQQLCAGVHCHCGEKGLETKFLSNDLILHCSSHTDVSPFFKCIYRLSQSSLINTGISKMVQHSSVYYEVTNFNQKKIWTIISAPLWCKHNMFLTLLVRHAIYWAVSKPSLRMYLLCVEVKNTWGIRYRTYCQFVVTLWDTLVHIKNVFFLNSPQLSQEWAAPGCLHLKKPGKA